MAAISRESFETNGRRYAPPARPIVVVCIDGCADEYLDSAMALGRIPAMQRMAVEGYRGLCRGALPAFTNTNNASIVTGVPPSEHGISGNFFLDPDTGEEVMMNAAAYLRTGTLLADAARAGRRVAVVTSKDKLRNILSHDLTGIAFSAEKAAEATEPENGLSDVEELVGQPAPGIYSAQASTFVMAAGTALIERGLADFLYLSLTDYIQHKHAPDDPVAVEFYAELDAELGRMLELGAVIGITADHGMNAKQACDGSPNVIFLEDRLAAEFGDGVRVILPITDPYVTHHGALGSYAVVHLDEPARAPEVFERLTSIEGITEVYDRARAAALLELPADRIGDLVVLSARDVVLGRRAAGHDLSEVASGLRSHGGRYEEMVPLLVSHPLSEAGEARARGDLRNFDVFDLTVNACVGG
ncbi:MAG: phosphonoacetate hydrolase [Planctomycetota bacterium]|jgi:phosphonoacetate hydrolase|nr:phosphonoacetate hydrolase [Planctomycetota bacterium]MDP6763802.1 phosphonoacetate hydrolase [Planctomycetota bacterium]MDP6989668.1 phosphonoacetate hydrolase [Planctomycetota bacterium]